MGLGNKCVSFYLLIEDKQKKRDKAVVIGKRDEKERCSSIFKGGFMAGGGIYSFQRIRLRF